MSLLRGLTAALIQSEMDILGDEITYTPDGGSPRTFMAWVEFDTEHFSAPGSSASKRVPTLEVQMKDIAAPKAGVDRIVITLRPSFIFTPADVREGPSGETWILPLKQVVA